MSTIETLLMMNLIVMIILGMLLGAKLFISFITEYIGYKLAIKLLEPETLKELKELEK